MLMLHAMLNIPLFLVSAIFGQKLEETMRFESINHSRRVPEIVQMCVEFITENGLDVEGLFR